MRGNSGTQARLVSRRFLDGRHRILDLPDATNGSHAGDEVLDRSCFSLDEEDLDAVASAEVEVHVAEDVLMKACLISISRVLMSRRSFLEMTVTEAITLPRSRGSDCMIKDKLKLLAASKILKIILRLALRYPWAPTLPSSQERS